MEDERGQEKMTTGSVGGCGSARDWMEKRKMKISKIGS
jgi:hypothetical protein